MVVWLRRTEKGGVYLTREVSEYPDGCRYISYQSKLGLEGGAFLGAERAGSRWAVLRVWQIKKLLPLSACLWWGVDD